MLPAFGVLESLADLKTVLAAIEAVAPPWRTEPEFPHLPQAARQIRDAIREHPGEHCDGGLLDMGGQVTDAPMLATASLIAASNLWRPSYNYEAKRYLAGALLELAAFERSEPDSALKELARLVRVQLNGKQGSMARLEGGGSACSFIAWLDAQPASSQYFTARFWKYWHGELSGRIKAALAAPRTDVSAGSAESPYEVAGGETTGGQWRPTGFLCPIDEEREELTPGAASAMAMSERATRVPLAAWTEGSIHYWGDETLGEYVQDCLVKARSAIDSGRRGDAEEHVARLLMLASATPARAIPAIRWQSQGDSTGYPGCLTLDAKWLKRAELLPPETKRAPGTVWIPIPRSLRQLLLDISAPAAGQPLLRWSPRRLSARDDELLLHATALQRALPSRLALDNDLGLTAAQWVSADTLGISTVPLHYDESNAATLARKIHAVSGRWFGGGTSLAPSAVPDGKLGAPFGVSLPTVRAFHSTLRTRIWDAQSVAERISARSAYIAHGLAASAGHRPSQAFAGLRLPQLGPDIAILSDKVVAPDWRCRPVAMAPSLWNEVKALVGLLREAATDLSGALGQAASAALAGSGPLLLVAKDTQVRPFEVADFVADMPDALAEVPNFARQLLNRSLISRIPEALRVGQMGWHGTREGVWAEGSPMSALDAARRLQKAIEKHLKDVGWESSTGKVGDEVLGSDVLVGSWTATREAEEKAFRAHVARLQKAAAERHAGIAKAMRPRLAEWLAIFKPTLSLDAAGRLRRAELAGEATPVMDAAELNRLERHLACNERQTERRAIARNLLSVLMRDARRSGAVHGPILRRVNWRFPSRPNGFSWVQPHATRLVGQLSHSLESSLGEQAIGGRKAAPALSYAAAFAGLILYGGYPYRGVAQAVLAPTTTLHRSRARPDVLLANTREDDVEAESDPTAAHSYAFHGRAALLLSRWHAQRSMGSVPGNLDSHVAELFGPLLPTSSAVDELIEVVRAERMLSMDGIARLIGSGQIIPTGADATRVIADQEDRAPPRGSWLPPCEPRRPTQRRMRAEELDTLYRELAQAARAVQERGTSEPQMRAVLADSLRTLCGSSPASPSAADLVARYALALLERGGMRRRHLQISTIRNYVLSIGRPLVDSFGSGALPAKATAWQKIFQKIVYQCAPERRRDRADAIRTFLWILSQEFELPVAHFEFDATAVEHSLPDAGYATTAEVRLLNELMSTDIEALRTVGAGAREIEDASASAIAVQLMSSTGQRPGEVAGVRWKDIRTSRKGSRVMLVRSSCYLSLKTVRARRRIRFAPLGDFPAAPGLDAYRTYARRRFGDGIRPGDSIWQLGRTRRLGRDALFKRPSFYLKYMSGRPDARPYWLRKAVIGRRLRQLMNDRADASLWAVRTVLAEIGHASIRTTLAHYIHDPSVPFTRWFRAMQPIDQRAAAALAGRGRHSGVRRGAGKRGALDPTVASDRIARLLAEIPFESVFNIDLARPAPITSSSRFVIAHSDLDHALRIGIAQGSVKNALAELLWPVPVGERLHAVLEELSTQWRITLLPSEGRAAMFPPPRRLSVDGGINLFLASGHPAIDEMAAHWLQFAAMPAIPSGVPGTAVQWQSWMPALEALSGVRWVSAQWGAYTFRTPEIEGAATSLWPLMRWGLLVASVRRMLVSPQ